MAKREKRGLGRGLSALMADIEPGQVSDRQAADGQETQRPRPDRNLPIERIRPNPDQPRRTFSEDALEELSKSIREKGIIQPLIVRPDPQIEGDYQIVAGERRWRAAQRAQLHEVPALVREFDDTEVLEVAIIENIQRSDLNAIEEAVGYRQLMDRFGHTQDKLGQALSKSRSHIANMLRLLNLPEDVQELVRNGDLSAGHARTLITAENASELARQIVSGGLSVRDAERMTGGGKKAATTKPGVEKDADTAELEGNLSAQLKMNVSIDHDGDSGGGRVTVRYKDLEQLDDLVRLLGG